MIENFPDKFKIKTNHTYPPNNKMIFEEYFYNYMVNNKIETKSYYLPVLWTNFYLSRGNGDGYMGDLQSFLDSLDRSKMYFTVLQYDDGILQNLSDIDIQVFCAGGGGMKNVPDKNLGYPIPLITQPKPNINKNRNRDIFSSFIGAFPRHKVRDKMFNKLQNQDGFLVRTLVNYPTFSDIMQRTIFSLCPRGYGATSFRICESLQHGSIPVYIYDKDWTPWYDEFDFNSIGIKIHEDDIDSIPDILHSKTSDDIKNYISNGETIYKEYFDYEGCSKKILEKCGIRVD